MSCNRCALRKARTKRPLCTRARRNKLHLERMMAQERTLKARRRSRTVLATKPVWLTRSITSPPTTEADQYGFNIVCYKDAEAPDDLQNQFSERLLHYSP